MKIAMIGQKGIPALSGGIERHVEELSTHLASLGHSVYVYTRPWYVACHPEESRAKLGTTKDPVVNRKRDKGVTLISLPSIRTKHLDAISHTLFASIHALFQNYDIIHYHGVGPSLLCWIPRIFSKAKIIGTFHCRDSEHKKWSWFARLMLQLGEWMICRVPHQTIVVSKTLQDYCQEKYHKETIYLPNGITNLYTNQF